MVTAGQVIQCGDPLLIVDLETIKDKVPSIITPVVFTSLVGQEVTLTKSGFQRAGSTNIISINK